MARSPSDSPRLRPSLLARLVNDSAGGSSSEVDEFFVGPEDYLESIRGDLEDLLNTRFHVPLRTLEAYKGTIVSILAYGLPDTSSSSAASPADREAIRRAIERAIEVFDPRLSEVTVELGEVTEGKERSLTFRVDAVVDLKPTKGRVFFDAALNMATKQYEIVDHFSA